MSIPYYDREPEITDKFLTFLDKDIQNNPQNLQPLREEDIEYLQELASGVEVDLDAPLEDEDD